MSVPCYVPEWLHIPQACGSDFQVFQLKFVFLYDTSCFYLSASKLLVFVSFIVLLVTLKYNFERGPTSNDQMSNVSCFEPFNLNDLTVSNTNQMLNVFFWNHSCLPFKSKYYSSSHCLLKSLASTNLVIVISVCLASSTLYNCFTQILALKLAITF